MPSTLTPVPSSGTDLPLTPSEKKLLEIFRSIEPEHAACWAVLGQGLADKYPRREPVQLRLVVSNPPRARARARRSK